MEEILHQLVYGLSHCNPIIYSVLKWCRISSIHRMSQLLFVKYDMGLSENSVPLNPMVNDHYPYWMAISLGILTQHFQTNPYRKIRKQRFMEAKQCSAFWCWDFALHGRGMHLCQGDMAGKIFEDYYGRRKMRHGYNMVRYWNILIYVYIYIYLYIYNIYIYISVYIYMESFLENTHFRTCLTLTVIDRQSSLRRSSPVPKSPATSTALRIAYFGVNFTGWMPSGRERQRRFKVLSFLPVWCVFVGHI